MLLFAKCEELLSFEITESQHSDSSIDDNNKTSRKKHFNRQRKISASDANFSSTFYNKSNLSFVELFCLGRVKGS